MIDEHLPGAWPPEVLTELANFRQGDAVARPPFFYAAGAAHRIWQCALGDVEPEDVPAVDYDLLTQADAGLPPFGMITTQTCDIQEQGRPMQPWVAIAPVYDANHFGQDQRRAVERHEKGYLIHLTGAHFAHGFFVADLRIEVPVEKGWLVGKESLDAFAHAAQRIKFADRLAARVRRPAFANEVVEHVVGPLRTWLRGMGTRARAEAQGPVEDIALESFGSPEAPDAVRLVLLTEGKQLSAEAQQRWGDWAATTQASFCDDASPTFLGVEIVDMGVLSASRYRRLVILDFRFLSPEEMPTLVA